MNDTEQKDWVPIWRRSLESQQGVRIHRDLEYTRPDGVPLHLDLCLPPDNGAPVPVVLWICWGGWCECNKNWAPYSGLLVANGFATASIQYRTSREAIAPANVHDCKAAVRWLRANADRYHLDPFRIGVWGSSAGGHLAALLGVSGDVPELEGDGGNARFSTAVQAACDFCGPSDLIPLGSAEAGVEFRVIHDAVELYLGGPAEERAALARLVSPLTYVNRNCSPMLIFHGTADPWVPLAESQALYDALSGAGADVEFTPLPGEGHAWDHPVLTDDKVIAFFNRTLKGVPEAAAGAGI